MKSLLLFLAGVLVGANLMYFAVHRSPRIAGVEPAVVAPAIGTSNPSAVVRQTPPTLPAAASPPAVVPPTVQMPPTPATVSPAAPPGDALVLPVQGVTPNQLTDTFNDPRGNGGRHEAIDIMAARDTPVLAAVDGTVAKLFTSVRGGLTIYEFDASRTYAYYYAHLDHYAPGLAQGQALRRGEVIGYVGSTGDASPDAPHLHFAIFSLGPEKQWWKGSPINPYPLLHALR